MSANATPPETSAPKRKRRWLRRLLWLFGAMVLLAAALLATLFAILRRVPDTFPLATPPLPSATNRSNLPAGLAHFDSPYLGHTGSWNGHGGRWGGGAKAPDLDVERTMGLHWTFMAVYWRALEPEGPVDLAAEVPTAWRELDSFVIAAHERGLNILMQAPVVGGNAGGPPAWAGRREKGKSAPANMPALAEFAGKLAQRYRPGGTLAKREGWGEAFGVRAWELDNEPEMYLTCWKGQAADYAEFVTLATRAIKAADPAAIIVAPGISAGKEALVWLEQALDAAALAGSPALRAAGKGFAIGPVTDVVSFHNYEGMDSAFGGGPRTITQVCADARAVFERWEQRAPGFGYARKTEYWHTEGNFDFLGILSPERRGSWRFQFFTRAFAYGIRKVCVMDASPAEQIAVRAYVKTLPDPFPMLPATSEVKITRGRATVFRHDDSPDADARRVWVAWADAGSEGAAIQLPVRNARVEVSFSTGTTTTVEASAGHVSLELPGDAKMSPGVLVLERK